MANRTYTGPLPALRTELEKKAAASDKGRAWRALEDGTVVAVIIEDGRPIVRLARDQGTLGWEQAFREIADQLGCVRWVWYAAAADTGAVSARFVPPQPPRTELVPCFGGCGEMASLEKGSFVGYCSRCSEQRRRGMGWTPVVSGVPECVECSRAVDENSRLYEDGRTCSACRLGGAA